MGGVATVVIPVCHSSLRQSRHLNHIAIAHGIALSDSVCSHIVDCSRLHVHPVDTSVVFQIFCCAVVEHCRIWFCAPAESLFKDFGRRDTAHRHTSECSDGSTHIALVCNYGRNGSCRVGEVILKRSLLEFGNLNLHFLKCSVEIVVHCLRSVDYAKELLRPLHFAFSISIFCPSNGCRKFFVGSDRQLSLIDSLAKRCCHTCITVGISILEHLLGCSNARIELAESGVVHLRAYIRFGSSYVVLEFSLEIGKLTASVVEAEVVDRNPVARSAFCNETDVCLALDISKH